MFRSDALYTEMNYMILSLSQTLLGCLTASAQQLGQQHGAAEHTSFLVIQNCVLHIFESILSQEELPDFYEEKLPEISQVCANILQTDHEGFT